jgi:hypothetical protein
MPHDLPELLGAERLLRRLQPVRQLAVPDEGMATHLLVLGSAVATSRSAAAQSYCPRCGSTDSHFIAFSAVREENSVATRRR